MSTRSISKNKRIAMVAHDNRKAALIDWAVFNKTTLTQHQLYATGTTGNMLQEAIDHPVYKFMSGPLGGDQQVGSKIAEGQLDILIFFWDPMQAQPHDPDIKALIRLAVLWDIPVACNRATADFILSSPFMTTAYDSQLPDFSTHLQRTW